MSETAAYAAGLMDADGYIGIHSRRRVADGPTYYGARITLGMTEPALPALTEFQASWGGSLTQNRVETDRWAAAWAWTLQGREAAAVLRLLMPYLRIKSRQAELAVGLEAFKASLPARANGSPIWTPEAEKVCAVMKAEIHRLNAKGPRAPIAEVS